MSVAQESKVAALQPYLIEFPDCLLPGETSFGRRLASGAK